MYYSLCIWSNLKERDANEDEEGDELFDDDVQIVIENLEGGSFSISAKQFSFLANHLYSNCEHPENYKVEMQKVKLLLGEAYILGGNYPLAEEILTDCLKNYQELKKGNSREVADVLYNLGVVQLAVAVTLALDSEDEENLAEEAEKKAKEAWKSLTDCQIMLCHVCLDKAIAEKIVEKRGI